MHPVGRNEAFVLLAIGFETDATVEKYLQIGPDFGQRLFAGALHDGFQQDEHPRRDAGKIANIGLPRAFDDGADLAFPFVHQDNLLFGHADEVDQRIQVL